MTYDQNGNLTNDGVNTYTWDVRNRLIGLSGGTTASSTYDPLGRRASKTINGIATQFLYDGNDIAAEIGGGAVEASRPVTAVAWPKLVCTRPVAGLIIFGSLSV